MSLLTLSNLLSWSAQVAAIVAAALLTIKLVRLDAPAVRYLFLRIVLAACLLLPFVQPYRATPLPQETTLARATAAGATRGARPASPARAGAPAAVDRAGRAVARAAAARGHGRRRQVRLDRDWGIPPAQAAARRGDRTACGRPPRDSVDREDDAPPSAMWRAWDSR